MLFGNGYKNQTGELVMEMELPYIIWNFGLIGFALYMLPFIIILLFKICKLIKNKNKITIENVINLFGICLAIALSTFSGYVFFNFSSMTMVLILFTRKYEIKK